MNKQYEQINKKWIIGVIAVVAILAIGYFVSKGPSGWVSSEPIKIGIITPLTGDLAFWGENSRLGVELAKKDLREEGINVDFIIEDGQLDPKTALNAAQKLVNIDKVVAIYSNLNPAAISVTSFVKDKDVLHLYNAAPVSPLEEGVNIYKTFQDFEVDCGKIAQLVKNRGIKKVGVLKMNMEHGDLCLEGIRKVYQGNVFAEEYNPGTLDFRTSLLKLKTQNVDAIFNISFPPETFASLRNMNELGMNAVFVGHSVALVPQLVNEHEALLGGAIFFGLPVASKEFQERLNQEFPGTTILDYEPTGLAYIHLKQLAHAFDKCGENLKCVRDQLDKAKPEPILGFHGFFNRVASFDLLIREWKNGQFVEITR